MGCDEMTATAAEQSLIPVKRRTVPDQSRRLRSIEAVIPILRNSNRFAESVRKRRMFQS